MDQLIQVKFVYGLNHVTGINYEQIDAANEMLYDDVGTEIGTVNNLRTRNRPGHPSRVIDANGIDRSWSCGFNKYLSLF